MLTTIMLSGGAVILAGSSFAAGYRMGRHGRERQAEHEQRDQIEAEVNAELAQRAFSDESGYVRPRDIPRPRR